MLRFMGSQRVGHDSVTDLILQVRIVLMQDAAIFYASLFFLFCLFHRILEKEMETHFSSFAWRTPWTDEPGGLYSTGSQRVVHD